MQRLGATLDGRMKATAGAAVKVAVELGTILSNMALKTDSLQSTIPKGAYMVNLALTGGNRTSSATNSQSDGEHSHELPDALRGLRAGDRVLVAWCGNEPVVVSVVVSS